MKPLLHVLGAGRWQCPTILAGKRLGCRVLVTDMYRRRPGYALCDEHVVCDLRDAKTTLKIARRKRVRGILCDTTDVGVTTASYVAQNLGLPGIPYEVALNFTDKARMRRLSSAAGILNPVFFEAGTLAEARAAAKKLGYPLMVKPRDNQASRGVSVVRSPSGLKAALERALKNTAKAKVLVEKRIVGTEVTVEGLALRGRYYTLAISDKDHYKHAPQVACRLTYPPAFPAATLEKIRRANEATVRALGLENGPTHGEYMVNARGVHLVEVAARGGGSRIFSHIAPKLSGVDLPQTAIRLALGRPVAPPRRKVKPGAANLEFFDFPPGRVRRIVGLREARAVPGAAEVELEFKIGDVLTPIDDDRGRHGYMVVYGATRAKALATSARIKKLVRVEISK